MEEESQPLAEANPEVKGNRNLERLFRAVDFGRTVRDGVAGFISEFFILGDPLALDAEASFEEGSEGTLLVEPDFRWPDAADDPDYEYPAVNRATVGKCACFLGACCCCRSPERCSCQKLHQRHEVHPRWWSGLLAGASNLYSLGFENHRSKALVVCAIVSVYIIPVLLAASGHYAKHFKGADCQGAFEFNPQFYPFYYPEASERRADPMFSDLPYRQFLPAAALDLKTAKGYCEAGCKAIDPVILKRSAVYSKNNGIATCGMFTSVYSMPEVGVLELKLDRMYPAAAFAPISFDIQGSATKQFGVQNFDYYRLLLVGMASSTSNRMFGFGGIGLLSAIAVDTVLLASKIADIQSYCPTKLKPGSVQNISTFNCQFSEAKVLNALGNMTKSDLGRQLQLLGFRKDEARGEWFKTVPLTFNSMEIEARESRDTTDMVRTLASLGITTVLNALHRKPVVKEAVDLQVTALKEARSVSDFFGFTWRTFIWLRAILLMVELGLLLNMLHESIYSNYISYKSCVLRVTDRFRCCKNAPVEKNHKYETVRFKIPTRICIAVLLAIALLAWGLTMAIRFWYHVLGFHNALSSGFRGVVEKSYVATVKSSVAVMTANFGKYNNSAMASRLVEVAMQQVLGSPLPMPEHARSCVAGEAEEGLGVAGSTYFNAVNQRSRTIAKTSSNPFLSLLKRPGDPGPKLYVDTGNSWRYKTDCHTSVAATLRSSIPCLITAFNMSKDDLNPSMKGETSPLAAIVNSSIANFTCLWVTVVSQGQLSSPNKIGSAVLQALLSLAPVNSALNPLTDRIPKELFIGKSGGSRGIMFEGLSVMLQTHFPDFTANNFNTAVSYSNIFIEFVYYFWLSGVVASWVAALVSCGQVLLFLKRVYWVGKQQVLAVEKHFDPKEGYNKALRDATIPLNDLLLLRGDYFTKREMRFISTMGNDHNREDALSLYVGKKLRYRALMHSTMFVGVYPFCVTFGFAVSCIGYQVLLLACAVPIFIFSLMPYDACLPLLHYAIPLVVLMLLRKIVIVGATHRMGLWVANHKGPSHPNQHANADLLLSYIGMLIGFFPAALRVVGVVLRGLVDVARVDSQLSYSSLDTPHLYYRGVIEEMRLRAEYRKRRRSLVQERQRVSKTWAPNPIGEIRPSELEQELPTV